MGRAPVGSHAQWLSWIKNSHDVKMKLETLNINLKKHTISKLDIIDMYPSVKIGMIKKAVQYYS